MLKMVSSSFYNTLIDNEEAIPKTTMLEIDCIRKKNILFTINTNRHYQEVLDYNKSYNFIDYIISLNGSYIYDVNNEKCLFKKKLSTVNLKKIKELYNDKEILYYTEDSVLKDFDNNEIYKVEIKINNDLDDLLKRANKLKVNMSTLRINNEEFLEMTSNNASMFTGLDKISLKNNFDLKKILSICGNDSDLPIVKNIEKAFIVKNASNLLKKETKRVTFSNNEKGVERVLKKIK